MNLRDKLILFDLDDTLIRSTYQSRRVRKRMLDYLEENGYDTNGLTEDIYTEHLVQRLQRRLARTLTHQEIRELKEKLFAIADRYENLAYAESEVRKEAKPVVTKIRASGAKLALVTNNSRKTTIKTLKRYDLYDKFDLIVSRDEAGALKPSPAGILFAIRAFKLPKKKVLYVGDSVVDVLAARAAGVAIVILRTPKGWSDPENYPDSWVDSLADLEPVLARWAR